MTPAALRIRAATPADYPTFVRFFAELGTGHAPLAQERWQATAMPTTLLFERRDTPVGYCMYEVLTATGYVRNVVVAPEARGHGVGRAMMDELRRRFRAAGCTGMCLNVKPDNAPAIALYTRAGMQPRYAAASVRLAWSALAGLPQPDPLLRAAELPVADHALFERQLALEPGIVQRRRELPDMLVLGLWAGDAPAGIACFDPHFPGATPFRARDVGAARALLEAVQQRNPQLRGIAVVVEDDPALMEALRGAGAELLLEMLHFHGPV
jgi:ribosomal protein S18 acetylase RimI-like enzyme